jgi:hypothetical protein
MTDKRRLGMRDWVENRFGKSADEVTISDVERELPRRDDLPDAPFDDRLGGRVRFRLRSWPSDEEAADLKARAEHFRAATPDE